MGGGGWTVQAEGEWLKGGGGGKKSCCWVLRCSVLVPVTFLFPLCSASESGAEQSGRILNAAACSNGVQFSPFVKAG